MLFPGGDATAAAPRVGGFVCCKREETVSGRAASVQGFYTGVGIRHAFPSPAQCGTRNIRSLLSVPVSPDIEK